MIHIGFLLAVSTNEENESGCWTSFVWKWLHDEIVTKDAVSQELAIVLQFIEYVGLANCQSHQQNSCYLHYLYLIYFL